MAGADRCCLLLHPTPAIQIAISGRPPSYQLGGPARRSLTRHGQADLAAECGKARIVLVAQDEGVVEKILDTLIAVAPGPIEPLEGRLRVVAQRVDFGDLVGGTAGILLDQCPKRRIGCTPVAPDLPCVGRATMSCYTPGGACCAASSAACALPRWISMIVSCMSDRAPQQAAARWPYAIARSASSRR